MLNNYRNRAAHAKGVICDLPIKNECQAGVIATLHFKIASRLFRSDAQLEYEACHKACAQGLSPAGYGLVNDKWIALHSPAEASQPFQLLQPPLKEHLPKGFNARHCAPEWDELKLRTWIDATTAILYAPCREHSSIIKTAFLFTLKFDDAGWKIIKTHQMSKKELEEDE